MQRIVQSPDYDPIKQNWSKLENNGDRSIVLSKGRLGEDTGGRSALMFLGNMSDWREKRWTDQIFKFKVQ